jgi:hypothetical protein
MPRTGTTIEITRRWDGTRLPEHEHARVHIVREQDELRIDVDAPFYADSAPAHAAGSTDRLWEHEVVELFLADANERYLEVELGPLGHYLVLELSGVRKATRVGLPIEYTSEIIVQPSAANTFTGRFAGHARLPASYLPQGVCRTNAYAIHGAGPARCYHAHASLPQLAPDFHRLETFVPCVI